MEVLSIYEEDGRCFPSWIVVPPTTKVALLSPYSNLPSVSELNIHFTSHWKNISGRCTLLRSLKNSYDCFKIEDVPALLSARRENVKAGMKVDGIKMEPLKRLVIRFKKLNEDRLAELGELVDQLVDFGSEPRLWDVEI